MNYKMKYIKKLNEATNDGIFTETFMKTIDKLIFDRLGKVTLDKYYGSVLYKRESDRSALLGVSFIEINNNSSGTSHSSANQQEIDNPDIKYRYVTEFKKQFNIVDKNLVNKQIRIYEKKLELLDILSDIKEKMSKVTHYCNVSVDNGGKNYLSVKITMGFSEDLFMGAAMRKVNNVVR